MRKGILVIVIALFSVFAVFAQTASNPAMYSGALDGTGPIINPGLPVQPDCKGIYVIDGNLDDPEYPNEVHAQPFYVTADGTYNIVINPAPDTFSPYAMIYEGSFDSNNATGNCIGAYYSATIPFSRSLTANTQYILVVSHEGRPTNPEIIKEGAFDVTISTAGDGEICIGVLGTCTTDDNGDNGDDSGDAGNIDNGNGDNGEAAPVIMMIPHRGMIQISTFQAQPLHNTPGGQPVRDAGGNEIWLPSDANNDGFDTYVVTETSMYNGRLWLGIFMGSATWGWVPADNITPLTFIPGYDDYMSSLQSE